MPQFADRPVQGFDNVVDRRHGWVDPVVENSGHMRLAVYGPDGDIMGHIYLSLIEFAKSADVVRREIERIFGPGAIEELPW
jgi:hypothetical protein